MKTSIPLALLLGCLSSCQPNQPCDISVVSEKYVHRYGVPLDRQEWSERGKHGQVILTLKDGVVVTQNYDAGVLHGRCSYTFPHCDLVAKLQIYNRGFLKQEIFYRTDGTPLKQIDYCTSDDYTVIIWDSSGAPQTNEEYVDGKLKSGTYYNELNVIEAQVDNYQGSRTVRDEMGELEFVDQIIGGELFSRTTYYVNGAPASVTPYRNGLISGERHTYSPGGDPLTIEQWSGNNQHGITILFERGEKAAEIPYINGKKHGMERCYRDGVLVVKETNWINDKKQGPCYTHVGEVTLVDWYYADQLVNKNTYEVLKSQE